MARHEHASHMRAKTALVGLALLYGATGDPASTDSMPQVGAESITQPRQPHVFCDVVGIPPEAFQVQYTTKAEELKPEEKEWYLSQARLLQSTYPLFSHSADPDHVPLTLPMPVVRYNNVNYVATDEADIYNYERLLYWNRVKESGFDPLQIDGGGNDFNHSYHGAVSPMGAEGAAQFLPSKWQSTVNAIVNGGRADALGYFNWRSVPQLANLGAYANARPNDVPAEMQDFVYRVEFTLTPGQWDPARWAIEGSNPVATNFINPSNAQ